MLGMLSEAGDPFALAEKISKDYREDAPELLAVLRSFYRDALLLKEGADAQLLVNRDRLADVRRTARTHDLEKLLGLMYSTDKIMRDLRRNVNLQLSVEALLVGALPKEEGIV